MLVLTGYRRWRLLALSALFVILLTGSPCHGDMGWLEIRRLGVAAMLDRARAQATPAPWQATWRAELDKKHPLHGIELIMSRRRLKAHRGQPAAYETAVTLRHPSFGTAGIATRGDRRWVRLPGAKIREATPALLFARPPPFGMPLAALALIDLTPLFDLKLVGEFGGNALVRMTPRFGEGEGLETAKIGLGKRDLGLSVTEVGPGDGSGDVKVLWYDRAPVQGVPLPEVVRTAPFAGSKGVRWRRERVLVGKATAKVRFGRGALR